MKKVRILDFVSKNWHFIFGVVVLALVAVVLFNQDHKPSMCGGTPHNFNWSGQNVTTSLAGRSVRSLRTSGDRLYVGFGDGGVALIVTNRNSMTIEHCTGPVHGNGHTVNDIITYNGSMFFATDQGGIWKLTDGQWFNYGTGKIGDLRIYDLYYEIEEDRLYAGTYNGVAVFDSTSDTWVISDLLVPPQAPQRFHAIQKFENRWLMGFDHGIYVLDGGNWTHYLGEYIYSWDGDEWLMVSEGNTLVPSNIRSMAIWESDEPPPFDGQRLLIAADTTSTGEPALLVTVNLPSLGDKLAIVSEVGLRGLVRVRTDGSAYVLNDYQAGTMVYKPNQFISRDMIMNHRSYDSAPYRGELIIGTDHGLYRSSVRFSVD